jgi:hypothetical protein
MDQELRRVQAVQDGFLSRVIRFSEEKATFIEKERKSEETIRQYTTKMEGMQERIDKLEQKEADLANLGLRLEAQQRRLDLGWDKLGEHVKKMKATRAKIQADQAMIDAKLKQNEQFLRQIEELQRPFDKVAQEVEVVSRKLTLQNVREFWNPEEAKALTDIEQVHQYFKIREIEMTKRERLLNEEIEKLRDAADRDRLQHERQLSESKRASVDLQRRLDDQAAELSQLRQEHQQFSEVVKRGISEADVLARQLSEEKRQKRQLEIVLERKMIAEGLEAEDAERARRRAVKAEMAQWKASQAELQKAREEEVRAQVKRDLTQRFRQVRDEILRKAAREKADLKALCEREHREAVSTLTQQFERRLAEETASVTQQCKEHYRAKLQEMQAPPKARRRGFRAASPRGGGGGSDSGL